MMSIKLFIFTLVTYSACVSGYPASQPSSYFKDDPRDVQEVEHFGHRMWPGFLRIRRNAAPPSRFDQPHVNLNRNPGYFNYQILPEHHPVIVKTSDNDRHKRSPFEFGEGRFDGVGSRFSDDVFRPPRFRDDQPRQPERSSVSDYFRRDCIEGSSCDPKPKRKYFDFYS